ncbi:cyanophycinase [Streptomyces radiopugnans]|uniref:Cyanophycinase n=1 Tax=Streptomyces radiopugnans TaxID=403935 RepID=A0A1H9KHR9_9ACTN|nr:cyanophycinase [Streptomyces radiopugnans]SEQ98485.1 cyanophycinase [Streptomyces radiopugnans]
MHRTRPRAGGSPAGSPAAAPPRRPCGVLAAAAAGLTALALLLPATAAAAAPATGPAPATARAPGGTLLMVGGALDDHNTEVYGEIVDRAGGPAARIGVLTAGSVPPSQDPDAGTPQARNSEANSAYYAGLLESHGAGSAEWIPVDLDRVAAADDPELAGRVLAMTGFFIGGGDQYRYVTTLLRDGGTRDSAVLAAVRQRLAEGAVVAGTSAGAQIQAGADMITGGASYEALRDGSSPGHFEDAARLGYLETGGFGFFAHGLVDTHFSARGREGRSLRLAADTGHDLVFGVDENTALEVTGVGTDNERLRVLGEHAVTVLDLTGATAGTYNGRWSVEGVRYDRLTAGDGYDPYARRALPAAGRTELVPRNRTAQRPGYDVFGPYRFAGTALDLAGSGRSTRTTDYTYETGPEFAVGFRKPASGYTAWTADGRTASTLTGMEIEVYAP